MNLNADGDPGWRPALRGVLYSLFPILLFLLWVRKSKREPRLILIRTVHVVVLCALFPLLLSVALLQVETDRGLRWWGWVLIVYPVAASMYFVRFTRRRVLEADTTGHAASAYVSGYLIALGLASAPALFGHALVYIGGGTFSAIVGTLVSSVLFWIVAPTRRRIASLDQSLAEAGIGQGLTAELMRPEPATS